jgi:hypothetical protein
MTHCTPPDIFRPRLLAVPLILCAVLFVPAPGRGGECVATTERVTTAVRIAAAGGPHPGGLALALAYPTAAVTLPGAGEDPAVRARVRDTPDGFLVATNDRGDALRIALAAGGATLPDGRLLTVAFDRCSGAPPAGVADFTCRVRSAADEFGQPLDTITCAIDLEAAPAAAPNPKEVGLR